MNSRIFCASLATDVQGSLFRMRRAVACILWVAFSLATAAQPPVQSDDRAASVPFKITTQYNIPYSEDSDPMQVADMYVPVSAEDQDHAKWPCVIMIHGGAWIAGDKLNDSGHARKLAAAGYVVMVINYRLAPKNKHPSQIDDCVQALRWLADQSDPWNIDIDRIGVYGYSAGGHLALLLATNPKEDLPRIKACVAGGAPCDFSLIPSESRVLSAFLGGSREELPEVYLEASPIEHISKDDPPIFVFHGEGDQLVPIKYAHRLQQKLIESNVPHEFLSIPKKSHIMAFVDRDALDQSIAFFNQHLHDSQADVGTADARSIGSPTARP
ncbi:MAG: alpha/beta hydrolase [Planctomycetota bacterium]